MKRTALLLMVLVLVGVPILACGLPGAKKAPTDTPVPSPTLKPAAPATPTVKVAVKPSPTPTKLKPTATSVAAKPTATVPKPVVTVEEEAPTIGEIPENIKTYRSKTEMGWEGEEDTGSLTLTSEFVREPLSERVVIAATGTLGGMMGEGVPGGEIELIRITDTTWIRMGEQWMQVATEDTEAPTGAGLFMNLGAIPDLGKARRLGDRTVNGIKCRGYTFDEKLLGGDLRKGLTEVVSAEGEAWVAAKEDFLVKITLKVSGEWQEPIEGKGTLTMEFDLYDLNEPFTIEPPVAEGEKVAGVPEDIPLLPDAKIEAAMAGMIVYKTESTVKEAAAFYEKEMPNNGWKQKGETSFLGEMAMLTFEKDEREVSIMIAIDEETKATGVIITGG